MDNYYRPIQARFAALLSRNGNSEAAAANVDAEGNEIALYERNSAFVSYGDYVASRTADQPRERFEDMTTVLGVS